MKTAEMFKILSELTGQTRILTIPRIFVERTGSHTAAILLAQALYWHTTQADEQGWVRKSDADIFHELLIKRDQLTEIREVLKGFGLVHARRGLPASSHYKVDIDQFVRAFVGDNAVQDGSNPMKMPDQTRLGENPKQDRAKTPNLTPEKRVPDVVSDPPSFNTLSTTLKEEKSGGISTGDLVGEQTGRREPPQRNLIIETIAAYDATLNAMEPQVRIKFTELQRITKRSETTFRAWVRDHVTPHMERLGSSFSASVDAACKAATLSNPNYALHDFVKSISSAVPTKAPSQAKGTASKATVDPLQAFIQGVLDESDV